MNDVELSEEHLDVYDRGSGPWNPEHGDVDIPADRDFLPSGDAFVTRAVKRAGKYWQAWRPRYRWIKRNSHVDVDDFLERHRSP